MIRIITEPLTERIANFVFTNSTTPSSKAVLKYGIAISLNYLMFALAVVAVAWATGEIANGIVVIIAFPFLRYFSGGLHLKSAELCSVISALIVLPAIYISLHPTMILILTLLSILILLVTAPANVKRSTIAPKYYPILKGIAMLIVATNLIFMSPVLAIAFFTQSLTTLGVINKTLEYITKPRKGAEKV